MSEIECPGNCDFCPGCSDRDWARQELSRQEGSVFKPASREQYFADQKTRTERLGLGISLFELGATLHEGIGENEEGQVDSPQTCAPYGKRRYLASWER